MEFLSDKVLAHLTDFSDKPKWDRKKIVDSVFRAINKANLMVIEKDKLQSVEETVILLQVKMNDIQKKLRLCSTKHFSSREEILDILELAIRK